MWIMIVDGNYICKETDKLPKKSSNISYATAKTGLALFGDACNDCSRKTKAPLNRNHTTRSMLPLRSLRRAPARLWSAATQRGYSTSLKESPAAAQKTKDAAATTTNGQDAALTETPTDAAAEMRAMQAPNRQGTWTRSQQVREKAMSGPRFEQMVMEDQVRPLPPLARTTED
jgi:hypothetical protein